jgi:hypothetical protein
MGRSIAEGTMTLLLAIALLGGTALPPFPGPGPEPEETIARFRASDLLGQRHVVPDPTGLDRTLLIAVTDRHAPEEIRGWLESAERYLPPGAKAEVLVSVDGADAVNRVKDLVPERYWGETLVDPGGRIARELGLTQTRWPQAYALDEVGRVLVGFAGRADEPAAERVWNALRPYARPAWPVW